MTAPTGSPPPIGAVLLARSDGSQFYNRGITKSKRCVFDDKKTLYFCWTGRYGYMGQGHFCKLGCGWRWACNQLDGRM